MSVTPKIFNELILRLLNTNNTARPYKITSIIHYFISPTSGFPNPSDQIAYQKTNR